MSNDNIADLIDIPLDARDAYDFKVGNERPVGYITEMHAKAGGATTDFDKDVVLINGEDPGNTEKYVCPLDERFFYQGSPTSPIPFVMRLSGNNLAKLSTCVTSITGGIDFELAWIVLAYNPNTKRYYRRADSKGLKKMVVTVGTRVTYSETRNTDINEPYNYTARMSLTGKGDVEKQDIHFAHLGLKVVRHISGIGAPAA